MTQLSRLSPLNIQDELIRTRFYRELRNGLFEWEEWEVSLDEIRMPELISLRYYGTDSLKKIVSVCAGLDDMRDSIDAGSLIRLPTIKWVRTRIRYYCQFEQEGA
ncbi:hypothetical protein PL84_03765 [Vibrio anguillarum]|uniref:hypothetical protein n=1 Tax=Vibrio anguillarum TaxID=55601 RepID=UPI00097E1804|nr:hypothetical protein [Vibrio anguillarum]MBT2909699.1 hypothetical protein [Vibrio anguillarum]MBT2942450.1 hypothetical protein [Vibrio anguillarum]MBT2950726.1 hypothetical protein [Vibrio anguillarum]MBT2979803.1 hypothetical protein [Vibrio anguillarum]